MNIVFLTTVYNRKDTTLACINNLRRVISMTNINAKFVIVDDNSNDGTKAALKKNYPDADILSTDGDAYWAGGMRMGYEHVKRNLKPFDYLIAFNDDSQFYDKPLITFLEKIVGTDVFVGAFEDKNHRLSYGGRLQSGKWRLNFGAVLRENLGKKVDVCNFNFVAISEKVLNKIDLIDHYFIHNSADYDFCLRAHKIGIHAIMHDQVIGQANRNSIRYTSQDTSLSMNKRLKALIGPKEYPIRQRWKFTKNHGGQSWLAWFVRPYFGFLFKLILRK